MSRGFIKEGDQEEIPMVPPRAHLPKGIANHVTHEGLEALREERKELEKQRAESGDNYVLANFIDAKLKLLVDRINSAVEVDLSKADNSVVGFGAWVRYNDRTIRIVGVDEADFSKGLLSFISPIAKALIGKRVGDSFEIVVPKGKEIITVQEISFEPLEVKSFKVSGVSGVSEVSKFQGLKVSEVSKFHVESLKCEKIQLPETSEPHETTEPLEAKKNSLFVPEENIMEFLPVVNDRGNMVGRELFVNLHKGNKILHPAVHLHVMNQFSIIGKFWWHVALGEKPEITLKRKLSDILGVTDIKPKLKRQYIRETKTEKELVYVFTLNCDEPVLKTPETKEYLEIFSKD